MKLKQLRRCNFSSYLVVKPTLRHKPLLTKSIALDIGSDRPILVSVSVFTDIISTFHVSVSDRSIFF